MTEQKKTFIENKKQIKRQNLTKSKEEVLSEQGTDLKYEVNRHYEKQDISENMFDENVIVTKDNNETNPDDTEVKDEDNEQYKVEESNEAIKDEGMPEKDDERNNTVEEQNINSINNITNESDINNTSNNTQNFISQMGHLTTKEQKSSDSITESTPSPSKEEISSNSEDSKDTITSNNKHNCSYNTSDMRHDLTTVNLTNTSHCQGDNENIASSTPIPDMNEHQISLNNTTPNLNTNHSADNTPKLIRHVIEDNDDMEDVNGSNDIPTATEPNTKSEDNMNDNDNDSQKDTNKDTNKENNDNNDTLMDEINNEKGVDESDEDMLKEFDESQWTEKFWERTKTEVQMTQAEIDEELKEKEHVQ